MLPTKPDVLGSLALQYDPAPPGGRALTIVLSVLIHLLFLLFASQPHGVVSQPALATLQPTALFAPPPSEKFQSPPRTPPSLQAPSRIPGPIAEPEAPSRPSTISADEVQLDRESLELLDPASQVEEVLTAHDGSVAFSAPDQEGRLQHIFEAPAWTPKKISGFIPADRYCSFTMEPPWTIATRLASANGLPRNSVAYVIFDRSMCNNIWRMIREFAGEKGIGCIKHAKLRFDSANRKLGLSVLDLNTCEAQQAAKQ